jgi:hypothetical protein
MPRYLPLRSRAGSRIGPVAGSEPSVIEIMIHADVREILLGRTDQFV